MSSKFSKELKEALDRYANQPTHETQPNRIAELEAQIDELKTICAETYQVVGFLSDELGIFDDEEVIKVLDNLSQQKLIHTKILPFGVSSDVN